MSGLNPNIETPAIHKKARLIALPKDHPAYQDGNGYGMFTSEQGKIKSREVIGEYVGVLIESGANLEDMVSQEDIAMYDRMGLDYHDSSYRMKTEGIFTIDASVEGNELRFINDFRGIGKANCEAYVLQENPYRVWIRAIEDIPPNSEILLDYGRDYWETKGEITNIPSTLQEIIDNEKLNERRLEQSKLGFWVVLAMFLAYLPYHYYFADFF